MKNLISISEARKRLPGIIKSLKTSPDTDLPDNRP